MCNAAVWVGTQVLYRHRSTDWQQWEVSLLFAEYPTITYFKADKALKVLNQLQTNRLTTLSIPPTCYAWARGIYMCNILHILTSGAKS